MKENTTCANFTYRRIVGYRLIECGLKVLYQRKVIDVILNLFEKGVISTFEEEPIATHLLYG
jgi:hypothetical protein